MKAIAAAFLVLLLVVVVNVDAGFSEASLSPSCSSRNNQHLKPLRNVQRNEYSSIHTGRQTCLPPEDGVSVTSTYASIPITIEPATRARARGTRRSATTASQVAVLTSPKNVVTIDNDNSNNSNNKSELRFISTSSHVVEPTIPAGMTIQFPSNKLQEIHVDGTDNVQVWEATSFTALERVVVTSRFSGRLLVIQDHYDTEDEIDDKSDRQQQSLQLVVDCQSCLVQVVTFPRSIRLDQSGGTVEIRQGTLDAASRFTGGTLLVQGTIQGLDARKALAGEGSITTTTTENCHRVVYDGFWGQPCQVIDDNVNSIPPPKPFECMASPCEQTCHSVVSKSGEVSCSCESSCQSKSHTNTSSRSSSSGESSESTTTSSSKSSKSSSNDWPASSSSSSWSDFSWKSHDDSDSSGWWSNSGFWDNNHDKYDKHHSSSSWGDDRKKTKNSQWINPIHAKASTIGGLWRVLAH